MTLTNELIEELEKDLDSPLVISGYLEHHRIQDEPKYNSPAWSMYGRCNLHCHRKKEKSWKSYRKHQYKN